MTHNLRCGESGECNQGGQGNDNRRFLPDVWTTPQSERDVFQQLMGRPASMRSPRCHNHHLCASILRHCEASGVHWRCEGWQLLVVHFASARQRSNANKRHASVSQYSLRRPVVPTREHFLRSCSVGLGASLCWKPQILNREGPSAQALQWRWRSVNPCTGGRINRCQHSSDEPPLRNFWWSGPSNVEVPGGEGKGEWTRQLVGMR